MATRIRSGRCSAWTWSRVLSSSMAMVQKALEVIAAAVIRDWRMYCASACMIA